MPTNTDIIRQSQIEVTALRVLLDAVGTGEPRLVKRLDELIQRIETLAADVKTHDRDIAALKQSSAYTDKQLDRLIHQRFTIWVALASAAFGSLLTFGSQLLIRFLTR